MPGFFDMLDAPGMIIAPPSVPPRLMDQPEKATVVRRMKRGGFSDDEIERMLVAEEYRKDPEKTQDPLPMRQPSSEAATRAPDPTAMTSPWAEQYGGTGGFGDFVKALLSGAQKVGPMMPTGAPAEPRLPGGMMMSEAATRPGAAASAVPPIPDLVGPGQLAGMAAGPRPPGAPPAPPVVPPVMPSSVPPELEPFLAAFGGGRFSPPPGAAPAVPQPGAGGAAVAPVPAGPVPPPGNVPGIAPDNVPDTGQDFFSALFKNAESPMFELGLRMMQSGAAKPGSTQGPSFLSAVGEAGMGTLDSVTKQKMAKAAANLKGKELQLKEQEILATRDLRQATLALKAQADQLRNEIDAKRLDLDAGTLAARLADIERKAIDDLRSNLGLEAQLVLDNPPGPDASANEKKLYQKIKSEFDRNEAEVRGRYERIRSSYGLENLDKPGASVPAPGTSGAASEIQATRVLDGIPYVKIGGTWYPKK